jgi:hypothetical protein
MSIILIFRNLWSGRIESVGSRVVYELDHKKLDLHVLPIHHILEKLPFVPVRNTGTIPHHQRYAFLGTLIDPGHG